MQKESRFTNAYFVSPIELVIEEQMKITSLCHAFPDFDCLGTYILLT